MASEIGIPYWIKRQSIKLRAPFYHSDADTLQHIQQSWLLQWSKWQLRDICNQNNICHVYFFQCKIRETASSMHSSYYHTPRNTPSTTARILGINPPSWTESTSMNADKTSWGRRENYPSLQKCWMRVILKTPARPPSRSGTGSSGKYTFPLVQATTLVSTNEITQHAVIGDVHIIPILILTFDTLSS